MRMRRGRRPGDSPREGGGRNGSKEKHGDGEDEKIGTSGRTKQRQKEQGRQRVHADATRQAENGTAAVRGGGSKEKHGDGEDEKIGTSGRTSRGRKSKAGNRAHADAMRQAARRQSAGGGGRYGSKEKHGDGEDEKIGTSGRTIRGRKSKAGNRAHADATRQAEDGTTAGGERYGGRRRTVRRQVENSMAAGRGRHDGRQRTTRRQPRKERQKRERR